VMLSKSEDKGTFPPDSVTTVDCRIDSFEEFMFLPYLLYVIA
jgi:hypothetical protein